MMPEHLFVCSCLTGSNYICDPPVSNTDIDILYLVYSLEEAVEFLEESGWKRCGDPNYELKGWVAYRKEQYNLILTENNDFFDRFEAATELAKKRNLTNKADRCRLFDVIVGYNHTKNVNPVVQEFSTDVLDAFLNQPVKQQLLNLNAQAA